MPDRRKATSTQAGILRPDQFARHARVERLACAPELDLFVENHWHLTWDLPDGARYPSQTLPHPACTLSVEQGYPRRGVGADRVLITGVVTRRFDVEIAERGWVFGIKFRPGGLAALLGEHARTWTDRIVPAVGVVSDDVVAALRPLSFHTTAQQARAVADRALTGLLPDAPDPGYLQVLELVEQMLGDRSLTRVADLEASHGLSRRQVERLFARYVGVGPKWLLARYRMHDVVMALDAGYDGTLADLAAEYGWYDQAHFTRDFTALVGVAPREYRATPSSLTADPQPRAPE